jgi:large subunit ribosomal protein L28
MKVNTATLLPQVKMNLRLVMSRKCIIDAQKGILVGNNVSHSNRKSRRRFMPNLQMVSFLSELLGKQISLRITPSTIRTIEHNDGIDNFLLTTSASKLTEEAQKLKKMIKKAEARKSVVAA